MMKACKVTSLNLCHPRVKIFKFDLKVDGLIKAFVRGVILSCDIWRKTLHNKHFVF